MKNKIMKKILLFFLLTINFTIAQNEVYHSPNADLQLGEYYALFGDDVKFRAKAATNSKVLALLKIGSDVELLEKTTKTLLYNGMESPFYKVKYNGKTGYILGGLISLEKKQTANNTYLFAYKKVEFRHHLLIRTIDSKGGISEQETPLGDTSISIILSDNKELKGIEHILRIENHPEACGIVGGDIYFFETTNGLKKAISTTIFSEAGLHWYSENLVFPTDENGIANRILYKEEKGEYGDEASNEVYVATTSRELRWENGELLPKKMEE